MRSSASLARIADVPAGPDPQPLTLIDGVPEPRLVVQELRVAAPLDERTATLVSTPTNNLPAGVLDRWLRSDVAVALPLRLSDGDLRTVVLSHGRLGHDRARRSATGQGDEFTLTDAWNETLGQPVSVLWDATGATPGHGDGPLEMNIGTQSNRSATPRRVGAAEVYVPEHGGEAWSVGTALETLFVLARVAVSTRLIPDEVQRAPLLKAVNLRRPLAEPLRSILEPYGLCVRRELTRRGGAVDESHAILPLGGGATISLGWPGSVLRIDADRRPDAARRWIARANGWTVESTFPLVAGWDPAFEGLDDSAYDRGEAGFPARANVYRLWALNEDGWFSAPPFFRGPAFDLSAFFDQGDVPSQPLRLGACVTLDDIGVGRNPRVEVSLDAGVSWSAYGGAVSLRNDRAAVYFESQTLPGDFLAAAKLGRARVRVTASLTCPLAVQAIRWRGNPFAGLGEPRVFDLADGFSFRRVAPTSMNYAAVASGEAKARQADDRRALERWLLQRMRREDLAGAAAASGRATLELAGVWPLLGTGERFTHAGGSGVDPAGRAEAIARSGAAVREVRCRWDTSQTVVNLNF